MVHNYYAIRGGEDACIERERNILERNNIPVVTYTRHNAGLSQIELGWRSKVSLGVRTIWSRDDYRALRELIRREKPSLMHVHNSFPQISPAALYAARREGIPVVQTLHNYRLICPSGFFMRDNRVCEDCAHKTFPWPAVVHSCYSHGRGPTAVVATMLATHKLLGTWTNVVDAFIAQTAFMRGKFVENGIPASKIFVKAGFVDPDPGIGPGGGDYAVYVGRLSSEKGIDILMKAWEQGAGAWPLKIVGEGPLESGVREAAKRIPGIEVLGRLPDDALRVLRGNAMFQIVPSVWYEGGPAVINEAFAMGLPVVASRIGTLTEMIEHGRNGRQCNPGDADDLADQVRAIFSSPAELAQMRQNARNDFLARYTADEHFSTTMKIYRGVLGSPN